MSGYASLDEQFGPGADDAEMADAYEDNDELCPDCGEGPYVCHCNEGADCGRLNNGRLMPYCTKAGSEECDFECPYRDA